MRINALALKKENDKLDFIKILNLFALKDNIKKMKRQATEGKIIFATVYLEYRNNFYNSITSRTKMRKQFEGIFLSLKGQIATKHRKKGSRSFVIRKLKLKLQ